MILILLGDIQLGILVIACVGPLVFERPQMLLSNLDTDAQRSPTSCETY